MTDFKLRCVVCGTNTGEPAGRDPKNAMRTFSFGDTADELDVYVIVGVCQEHETLGLTDIRRRFYEKIFQVREWETAHGLELREREEVET